MRNPLAARVGFVSVKGEEVPRAHRAVECGFGGYSSISGGKWGWQQIQEHPHTALGDFPALLQALLLQTHHTWGCLGCWFHLIQEQG